MTEIFIRRGFFTGWKAEDLRKYGISGVSDSEISALQVAIETDLVEDEYAELVEQVKQNSSLMRAGLLIGTQKK